VFLCSDLIQAMPGHASLDMVRTMPIRELQSNLFFDF